MLQQGELADSILDGPISIADVSKHLDVSEASVRNWIKTGYLQFSKNTGITSDSFKNFCNNVAGVDKLNGRANKSLLDSHDHEGLVSKIRNAIDRENDFSKIAKEYELGLSNAYRNKEGIYYTPEGICNTMFSDIPSQVDDKSFCDPCCGGGNFILAAIRHGFKPENIHGYDTDPTAVDITRHRIYEETGYQSENIKCLDFLSAATAMNSSVLSFDAILTNPPWGKRLQKQNRLKFGKILGAGRSLDTSSLFFFASLKSLKNEGYLAFLMPEAFLNIAAYQDARRKLLSYSMVSVRNFDKPFKGLLTRAQSFCVQKTKSKNGQVNCTAGSQSFVRPQKSFSDNPAHIINFESSKSDTAVLSQLFSKPHTTLEGNARWGLGIVTGNNRKFCIDRHKSGYMPVFKGEDIHKDYMDEPKTFIPKDLSLYQQVAQIDLYEAREKILYRFISSDLVFHHDRNQSFCLNSANMIVLSEEFPVSAATLVRLFNTDLFNWAFGKIFNTHKVLRADLERMPVPIEFLAGNEDFTEEELLDYCGIEKVNNKTFKVKK